MSVWFIPPYTPLLYSKTGVYRGIHFFLIFALKHRLWVVVRTVHIKSSQKTSVFTLIIIRPKKKICVFPVTSKKKLG